MQSSLLVPGKGSRWQIEAGALHSVERGKPMREDHHGEEIDSDGKITARDITAEENSRLSNVTARTITTRRKRQQDIVLNVVSLERALQTITVIGTSG